MTVSSLTRSRGMNPKVHPAAECVRLMDDEELASLAADIKTSGQRDAITLGLVNGSKEAQLVDGRNRLRACSIAGVDPRFITVEFETDELVRAFVKSKTEHRNITKGQKAMRLALLWPEAPMGRGAVDPARKSAETADISMRRLQQARQVLAYSRPLALAVRDGPKTLDDALAEVKTAREELQSDEAKLAELRAEAPDLAVLVIEQGFKVEEQYAALLMRRAVAAKDEASTRSALLGVTHDAYRGIVALASDEFVQKVHARIGDEKFRAEMLGQLRVTREEAGKLRAGLKNLESILKQLGESQ